MKKNLPYYIIALLLILYSSAFIWRTSVVVENERYFLLFDDAMISMDYARNLAQGQGLVMNPGERVEGITNPLWTVIMAGFHFLPLPSSKMSLAIQILGIMILLSLIPLIKYLSMLISPGKTNAHLIAVLLGGFYFPLINWTLQGLEVGLLAVLVVSVSILAIKSFGQKVVSPWLYPLLGLGTLVRLDFAIIYIAVWGGMMFLERDRMKNHFIQGIIFLILFLGGQTLARILYYGEFLPNTYYLKMTGYPIFYRLTRGLIVFLRFAWQFNPLLFILPFAAVFYKGNNAKKLLLSIFVLQSLYSIWVGGDAWEEYCGANRYISASIPVFFVLFADGLIRFIEFGMKQFSLNSSKNYFWLIPGLVCLLIINTPRGATDIPKITLAEEPFNISLNRDMVGFALTIKKITNPGARIGVTWAGIIPYISERPIIDFLGKTDKVIARKPMHGPGDKDNRFTHFHPGHLKWDNSYSIGELKPDLIIQFWGLLEEAEPYIIPYYQQIQVGTRYWYARAGSDKIKWGAE